MLSRTRPDQARDPLCLLRLVAITSLLLLSAPAADAQVSNVDWELQEVYEHYMGVSLAEAVLELRQPQELKRELSVAGGVKIRFNGGGLDNRLYIGQNNTLEILIRNETILGGMSLGFEFTCLAGSFGWVEGYGDYPAVGFPARVVKMEEDLFPDSVWDVPIIVDKYPDSILIGGIAFNPNHYLWGNWVWEKLYSMQIYIPEGTPAMDDGFVIDNIFMPPAGHWVFSPPPQIDSSYAPTFQHNDNTSTANPDAPPVYFDIVEGFCHGTRAGSDSLMVTIPPKDWPHVVKDYENYPALHRDASGKLLLRVYMYFTGDDSELESLGAKINQFRYANNVIFAKFPLEALPRIVLLEGVKHIYSPEVPEIQLNYVGQMIHCNDTTNQQNHKASGVDAIIGIIDTGAFQSEADPRALNDTFGDIRELSSDAIQAPSSVGDSCVAESLRLGAICGVVAPPTNSCIQIWITVDRLANGNSIDSLRRVGFERWDSLEADLLRRINSNLGMTVAARVDSGGVFRSPPLPEGFYNARLVSPPGRICPLPIGNPYMVVGIRVQSGKRSSVTQGVSTTGIEPRVFEWEGKYVN